MLAGVYADHLHGSNERKSQRGRGPSMIGLDERQDAATIPPLTSSDIRGFIHATLISKLFAAGLVAASLRSVKATHYAPLPRGNFLRYVYFNGPRIPAAKSFHLICLGNSTG